MKKTTMLFITACLVVSWSIDFAYGKEEIKIWKDFVEALKNDKVTLDQIRPHLPLTKESQLEILDSFRRNAVWEEWEAEPEIIRYENHLNFLIPLKLKGGERTTYCFTFLIEDSNWYYRHVEAIFIRLDKISSLPTSDFPDISESQKAWAREEIQISEHVRLFNMLLKEKGKDFAFNWFKNGVGNGIGYFLGAKTWIPFIPPSKAFILYICWEQANLKGNKVWLDKLEEDEAVIRMVPLYFIIFRSAVHLKRQIAFEDYRRIFEIIWEDRAKCAGWNLEIKYRGQACVFYFTK